MILNLVKNLTHDKHKESILKTEYKYNLVPRASVILIQREALE